ncbi:fasciclin domain-containing protein [Pseudonocardia alaniniphila]|uniref:Fasciclin domain-containing protein n=1 Tax=Pseudonocardia alaniniphila TaxID=75291 RepID=A0ABS9TM84_9PSEU|nr:fasciclin domain-containing protein [Pseudonocardia alaniniphila]MCH6169642.1 fasciclin domain-containing protein [Pseudonocardia alaniniphila]
MRQTRRLAALAAMTVLAVALAGCSASEVPPTPAPTSAPDAAAPTSGVATADDGVTTVDEAFGPGCSTLPQGDAPGSAAAMAGLPVAAAVGSNPSLTTLARAISAVPGLAETLNAQQDVTLFAPSNAAFDATRSALGDEAYNALMDDPQQLSTLLSYHVVAQRFDAAGLVRAGTTTELTGGEITIGGTAEAPTLTGGDGTQATVLCGDLPTKNATLFVIDKVLRPAG